jgi:hypothetical protein
MGTDMKKTTLLFLLCTACDACEVDDPNAPPIASLTDHSTTEEDPAMRDDATEGSSDSSGSSSSTSGADTSTGEDPFDDCLVERVLTWLDEDGHVVGTPMEAVAQYAYEGDVGDLIVLECGYIDDVPVCWVPCSDEHPIALTIEWFCPDQPLVHVVFNTPIPLQISLEACSVTAMTSTGSESESDSEGSSSEDEGSTSSSTTDTDGGTSGSSSTGV